MSGINTVAIGDLRVSYQLEGAVGAPVVMLAHGIMTSHRMWDPVVPALAAQWRVLRYDLRGHGATEATDGPYTMRQLVGDAVGLLDALGLHRVHFAGSSLGGMIGQQLGARHGDRLCSLTLSNTSCMQSAPQVWEDRMALARANGVAALVERTLQRWFTEAYLSADAAQVAAMRRWALETSLTGFLGCAAAVRDLAQADLLTEIHLPTLVIAGEQDRATPVEESRVLQRGIKGAELATLPAAHQSAVECPSQWAVLWNQFVHRAPPPDVPQLSLIH